MQEQPTPFQQLLKKMYWWCDAHATEENLKQLKQWMQESEHTQERVPRGKSFCLQSLINSKATPNDITQELFDFLVAKGADIDYEDGYGNLLHIAIITDKQDIFEQLLKAGVDPNRTNRFGDTPLHLAVSYNRPFYVKKLLELKSVQTLSLYEKNKKGQTPPELMTKETDFGIRTLFRQYKWSQESTQNVASTLRYRASIPKEEQPLLAKPKPDQAKSTVLEQAYSQVRKILGF